MNAIATANSTFLPRPSRKPGVWMLQMRMWVAIERTQLRRRRLTLGRVVRLCVAPVPRARERRPSSCRRSAAVRSGDSGSDPDSDGPGPPGLSDLTFAGAAS